MLASLTAHCETTCVGAPASWRTLGQRLGAFALTLALVLGSVTLLSPSGLDTLGLPFRFAADEYFNQHLREFRPLWAFPAGGLSGFWPAWVYSYVAWD